MLVLDLLRVGQENKLHERLFFLAKESISIFGIDTLQQSAALLFQYARCAHIYRGPNVLLVLLLVLVLLLLLLLVIPLKIREHGLPRHFKVSIVYNPLKCHCGCLVSVFTCGQSC